MYLAPPLPQGLSSLQGAAGATRAPQGAVWGSEGVAGCAGVWTSRRAGSPPHPAGEKTGTEWGGGVSQGTAQWAGRLPRSWGRGTSTDTYPEELLELGAVVERRDVHSEAKQVLGPLPPLFDH